MTTAISAPASEPITSDLEHKIKRLQGPILVLGASGFVGANLLKLILRYRHDAYGTATRLPAWRLSELPRENVREVDLLANSNLDSLIETVRPRTIFDCVAYGAYSFETDSQLIYNTNFNLVSRLLERLKNRGIACYLHAGSSSEYGDNASGPAETAPAEPNSHYAVSKVAAANLIHYYGKKLGLPCANLRLYSVYGPGEDSSRLIPNLVRRAIEGSLPDFVDPSVSRDFIYVDDCAAAFIDVALELKPQHYGESFNIGSGQKTTIRDIAYLAKDLFGVTAEPSFTMQSRSWDVADWYANTGKARTVIGWEPRVDLREGLLKMAEWLRSDSRPGGLSPILEALRSRHQAQRDGRHRLLQGRAGDTDHVRAAEKDFCRAQRRLRNHLRQRQQPRRYRGRHPRNFPQRSTGLRRFALPQFRVAGGVRERDADRLEELVRPSGRRLAGPAGADRGVRREMARGIGRGLWKARQTPGSAADAIRLQGFLPRVRLVLVPADPA